MIFSQSQKDVFNGIMLSDAWLLVMVIDWVLNKNKNSRSVFKPLVGREPFKRSRKRFINAVEKTYESWSFHTLVSPMFSELHKKWYNQAIDSTRNKIKMTKIVPEYIKFNPTLFAFWIIGDGSLDKIKGSITLCTLSFSHRDVK